MDVKLTAILSAKVDAFINGINQAQSKLQKFGQDAERIGAGLSIAISAPLALLGRASIKTASEFDSLERGLASLEKNATTLEARLKTLTAVANLPGGLGFKEAVAGDVRLRTILNSIYGVEKAANLSVKTLRGFSNAAALVGKGQVEISRALYGVQQLANTEFPLGEDLNIIKDAIPQVSAILNEAFGTTRTEQLQKMRISSQQVFEAILTGLEKLPTATVGIASTFDQMQQAIDERLSKIGKSLFRTFDISGAVNTLLGFVDKLIAKFDALSPVAQKVVVGIGAILVVIPPIITAIGLIAPAISAGIGVIAALNAPIVALAAGIGVAISAIIANWDKVKRALVDSGVWQTLTRIVSGTFSGIVSIFAVFANLIQGDWTNFWKQLGNVVLSAVNLIVQAVGDALIAVISLIQKISLIKMPSLELSKAGIRGLQEMAFNAVTPASASQLPNAFAGFNFFGGNTDPLKKNKPIDTAAAKKALDDYVKAQSEASKSIIDSLQRTRDISISLITDETERKRAELRAQAADRRAQVESDVQSEAQRAREITAINEKLAQDLKELEKQKQFGSWIGLSAMQIKQPANTATRTGDTAVISKNIDAKSNVLPNLNKVLESFDNFNKRFSEKAEKSAQLVSSLNSTMTGAIQDMAVGIAEAFSQLGTGGIEGFASNLLRLLGGVISSLGRAAIAAGTAALSLKTVFATPAAAIAAGAAAIVVGGIISSAASNTQKRFSGTKLARGGAVYGPTVALVGDNPGAFVDPEIIGPSSMMRRIVREETQGAKGGYSVGILRGADIYLAGMEEVKVQNSFLR